jgi:hypothetical protein
MNPEFDFFSGKLPRMQSDSFLVGTLRQFTIFRQQNQNMKHVLTLFLVLCFASSHSFGQKRESLKIVWPEEYKWKVGSNQETETVHMMELIPGNETVENWTIIGTMMSYKGAQGLPVDKAMNLMFDQTKKNASNAKLTLIEKDEAAKHPWILFKIESPKFNDDPNPESQLYYIIQGSSSLYSNFVALKKAKLDDDFVNKWKGIFRAGEFVYE